MPSTRNERTDLVLPLPGLTIEGCLVDHGFNLVLEKGTLRAFLRVEGWVRLTTKDGPSPEISALDHGASSIAKRLVGRVVKTASVLTDGDLALTFEDGAKFAVEADREYQSWELLMHSGYHVTCGPGGRIAIKQEEPPPKDSSSPRP